MGGDGDIPDGFTSSRWAGWDVDAPAGDDVLLTHIEGSYYTISQGTRYLSWTEDGDGSKGTCKYWGYWASGSSGSNRFFTLDGPITDHTGTWYNLKYVTSGGTGYGIRGSSEGDGDK